LTGTLHGKKSSMVTRASLVIASRTSMVSSPRGKVTPSRERDRGVFVYVSVLPAPSTTTIRAVGVLVVDTGVDEAAVGSVTVWVVDEGCDESVCSTVAVLAAVLMTPVVAGAFVLVPVLVVDVASSVAAVIILVVVIAVAVVVVVAVAVVVVVAVAVVVVAVAVPSVCVGPLLSAVVCSSELDTNVTVDRSSKLSVD
jgi:hypothetical protein